MRRLYALIAGLMLVPVLAFSAGSYEGEVSPGVQLVLQHKVNVQMECTLLGRCATDPMDEEEIMAAWAQPDRMLLFKRMEKMAGVEWIVGGLYVDEGMTFVLPVGTRFVLEYDGYEICCEGVLLTDGPEQSVVYDLNERRIVIGPEGDRFWKSDETDGVVLNIWVAEGLLPEPGWFNRWSYGKPVGVRLAEGVQDNDYVSESLP